MNPLFLRLLILFNNNSNHPPTRLEKKDFDNYLLNKWGDSQ